jgi:hypothetical protein
MKSTSVQKWRPLAAGSTGTAGKGNPVEIAPSLPSERKPAVSPDGHAGDVRATLSSKHSHRIARTHVDNIGTHTWLID